MFQQVTKVQIITAVFYVTFSYEALGTPWRTPGFGAPRSCAPRLQVAQLSSSERGGHSVSGGAPRCHPILRGSGGGLLSYTDSLALQLPLPEASAPHNQPPAVLLSA